MLKQKIKYLFFVTIVGWLICVWQDGVAANIPNSKATIGKRICLDSKDNIYVTEFRGDFWVSNNHGKTYSIHKVLGDLIWGLKVYHDKKTNNDVIYLLSADATQNLVKISYDQGKSFQDIKIPVDYLTQNLAVDSKGQLYIGTFGSGVLVVDKAGKIKVRNHYNSNLLDDHVTDIFVDNNDKLYVLSESPLSNVDGISISSDGGVKFNPIMLGVTQYGGELNGVSVDTSKHGVIYVSAFGVEKGLLKSDDGGKSFQAQFSPCQRLYGEFVDRANNVYLLGAGIQWPFDTPVLAVSFNGGAGFATYTKEDGLEGDSIDGLAVDSKGNMYAVANTLGEEDHYILISNKVGNKIIFSRSDLK